MISPDPWEEAICLCRPLIEDRTELDKKEIKFKLLISERLRAALDGTERGEPLDDLLKKVFASPNTLVHNFPAARFREWAAARRIHSR